LVELGAALRRANSRAAARDPLRRGRELAHECGATVIEEQALTELRATGARPRRIHLSGVDALTAAERRVAELAARGMTNREIAQALFVSAKTVETHIAHVFQKLDLASRKQLRTVLRQAGAEATARSRASRATAPAEPPDATLAGCARNLS
jgi:DNA-binding CsgD family transcriptional regulator